MRFKKRERKWHTAHSIPYIAAYLSVPGILLGLLDP